MGVHNLADKSAFTSDILSAPAGELVVLDCFATWCGPCKVIAPKLVKFSEDYPDVKFYKVDVDEVNDVAQELGIRAMPTFLLFKNGEKVAEIIGANERELEAAAEQETGTISRQYDRGSLELALWLNRWISTKDVALEL